MDKKNLGQKFKDLLGSARFWMITVGLIVSLIKMAQMGGLDIVSALTAIQAYIGVVAGIGTLDSLALKLKPEGKS